MTETCPQCGEEFDSLSGVATHRWNNHEPPWHDKDRLYELYVERDMTMAEIAEAWNTSDPTILRWLRKFDISTKPTGPNNKTVPTHEFVENSCRFNETYERVRVTEDYESKAVFIHRLIAIAHGKMPPSDLVNNNKVVHHKSGHGLDNRPGNLEVMSRSEHNKHHHSN